MAQDYDKQTILSEYKCSFVSAKDKNGKRFTRRNPGAQLNLNLSGSAVKKFYVNLINEPSQSNNKKKKFSSVKLKRALSPKSVKQEFDNFNEKQWLNRFIKSSSTGDLDEVKNLVDNVRHRADFIRLVNLCDSFGWTGLMCAAAEGYVLVALYLTEQGCRYKNVYDSSGMDVFDICRKKQQFVALDALTRLAGKVETKRKTARTNKTIVESPIKCELCGGKFLSSKQKEHESSMIHIFKDEKEIPGNVFSIPGNNVGYQMMLRSGWTIDKGLGPEGSGRKNPVKTILKQDRTGLGLIKKKEERVSHFSAYDVSAVLRKKEPPIRLQKKVAKKTFERKRKREKDWEQNLRRYMSSDFE